LERDNFQCQIELEDGRRCLKYATVAGHIIPDAEGGSHDPENLRAECRFHSNKLNNPKAWAKDRGHPANVPSRNW
jgi:5-methylcytosine-specific restriction endonuclease McrA